MVLPVLSCFRGIRSPFPEHCLIIFDRFRHKMICIMVGHGALLNLDAKEYDLLYDSSVHLKSE